MVQKKKSVVTSKTAKPKKKQPLTVEMVTLDVDHSVRPQTSFPVVGIGASGGGLEALELFLANVPIDSGMAFVIIQRLDPTHKGIMVELLQRSMPMRVFQVEDHTRVKPNCVYVIPPNKDMSFLRGVLYLLDPAKPRGLRLPIDLFFRSLADDQHEQLMQSQAEVETGLMHYADLYKELYDFAPVGYFTLSRDGTIQRANLTGERLLGVERGKLIKRRFGTFIAAEFRLAFKDFLEKVFKNHGEENYEAALLKDGNELFWAHLEAVIENGQRKECRIVMVDITERKQVEIELQQHKEDLELINKELAQSRAELEAALRQYNDLYDFAPVSYFTINRDGTILQVNLAGARLLGVEYGKLIKQNFGSFVFAEYRPAFNAFFEKLLTSQGKEICELELLKDGNEPVWVSIDASSFEGGPESRTIVVDIDVRKQAEQILQMSEKRFRMLLQDVPTIAVQGYAMDGTTQYWNFASERLYGYSAQEALGRNLMELIIPPEMRSEVRQSIQQMVEIGRPIPAAELSLMRKDGSRVTVYSCHTIVTNPGHEPELFCLDVDLTERKQVEDELRRAKEAIEAAHLELQHLLAHEQILARTDGLTGLCNRRYFFELAFREFNATLRYQRSLTMILFDVDGFKQVNDTFGHETGDKVLIFISEAAVEQIRAVDVLARYGGDEFIILLPQTSAQRAFVIAERIRESVAALQVETDSGSLAVTLSIGVAETIMLQDESVENVIRRADKALYAAKESGHNCTVIYE